MTEALSGFTVLDLSRLLPWPFCSMLLADMGADVIKIEEPESGDYIRWWPPMIGKNSGFHVVLNRNKRSLTLNLKAEDGKKIFRHLVQKADVVLEGFRPGVMERLGVGYEALKDINPRLVYCSITGYGREGSRSQKAGHDINYLALSGVRPIADGIGTPHCLGFKSLIWEGEDLWRLLSSARIFYILCEFHFLFSNDESFAPCQPFHIFIHGVCSIIYPNFVTSVLPQY